MHMTMYYFFFAIIAEDVLPPLLTFLMTVAGAEGVTIDDVVVEVTRLVVATGVIALW